MARLNIEDSLFSDERFIQLRQIVGCRDAAIGLVVFAWRFAQKHVSIENPNGLMRVVDFLADSPKNHLLIDCGLVQIDVENPLLCYAKGSNEQFRWIVSRMHNSRSGVARRREINNLQRPYGNRNEAYDNPLTLTLTHALYKERKRTTNKLDACTESSQFLSFWEAYPKEGKLNKTIVAARYAQQIKNTDIHNELMRALENYKLHKSHEAHVGQAIKHASSFLGTERSGHFWKDFINDPHLPDLPSNMGNNKSIAQSNEIWLEKYKEPFDDQ